MKSTKKRIIIVFAILTMALVLSCAFVACDKKDTADKTNPNDLGVYYEVVGSSLDENSYIELKSGNVWYDGEDQGTFKITDGNITLYDGDTELMNGTISNGVLTLSFMGETTVYKKTGSMGSENVDQKAMIKSIQNGKVDGLTVSLEIDNTVEDVDLSGMITTSKDSSWQLYTSRSATAADAIVTKIIVPKNGNNTYYIVVTSADGKTNRTYTLNVWKNYYATLSFYTNGSFYTSEQVLTHTTYGSGPSCSVAGYTFNGWGCDGYYVTESKSFNANLTPLTYTAKFDSNGGSTLSDKTATFNKDLSLPTPYRTGYTFLGWYLNGNLYNDSIKYTYANDSTFTARWQINSYNVVIKSDNEELGTVQAYNGEKDYNSSVSLSATPKIGYSFVGWFANGTKISTNKTCTINVPAYDVTYVAIFEKDERLANFKCSITENSCVITGVLDKNITTVLIPDYVTGIGDYAFRGCTGLTSVTIPDSVTSIGEEAFYNCTGLTSVTIGGSVTSIGTWAFKDCTRLTSVTVPDSVTSIGDRAFYNCTGLTTVNWNATACTSAGSSGYPIFEGCSNLATVNIGDNVKIIPSYAFYNCTGLTNVTIPDSVTSIGSYAFSYCTGLTRVTIGKGVTSIGNNAFYHCYRLIEVYNKSTLSITADSSSNGYVAYYAKNVYKNEGGSKLTTDENGYVIYTDGYEKILVAYHGTNTELILPSYITKINQYAFYNCKGLTSITIPNSVTSIGEEAFYNCTGLTSVTIGGSVTSIGTWAFKDCTRLTSITIPNSVTSIGGSAFEGCTGLTSVTIGNSVTSIGNSAFEGCTGLTSITIPNSVTSIGKYAFSNCTGLTTVNWNATACTSAGSWDYPIFKGCSNLATVNIGDNVKIIPSSAFSGCTGLTSITIPNSVTSIGRSAFYYCTGLTTVNWNATACTSAGSVISPIFEGCSNLATVNIGDNVKIIPSYAFDGCTGLTSIYYTGDVASWCGISGLGNLMSSSRTLYIDGNKVEGELIIPDSVTSIGSNAFRGCTGLTSITIPDSVTSIGYGAFRGCTGLTSVTLPFVGASETKRNGDDQVFGYIFGYTTSDSSSSVLGATYQYYGNYKYYHYYIPSSIKSVTITRGIIPSNAFYNCTGLTSVTIGNSVTSIGSSAFYNCTGLTSVTIPDSVTSIGYGAFRGCTGLTSVTLPFVGASETKRNGDDQVFGYIFGYTTSDSSSSVLGATYQYYGNYKYYHYYIPSSIKSVTITRGIIPSNAFYNCTGLTSVTIGNSVTSIGSSAFYNCTGLTSITIPDSVTSIGERTFEGCTGLTSVTIGNSVTSIGSYVFDGTAWYNDQPDGLVYAGKVAYKYKGTMPSNTSIALKEGTLGIAGNAFYNCTGLTSVTIPDSVTSIGYEAFRGCSGLTSITIPDSVTSIGESAFYGCKGLTSVTIGKGVTSIGHNAFNNCTGLTSVTIPDSVTSIGSNAFYGCTGLTNITIPDSVTSIGYSAFYGCKGLTSVTIPDSVTSIGYEAFRYCTRLTSVTIPDSVTSIGDSSFYNCTGLTSITIPDSVTSIGDSSFYNCTGLTSITIPDSVTSIGRYAFYNTGLTSVTIGKGVTSIGADAFGGCNKLQDIYITDIAAWCNISGLGNLMIYDASNKKLYINNELATSIIIPDSVTSIGSNAFRGCTGLTSVTIGNSVTSIGSSAFSYCTGLTSITVAKGNTKYHSAGNCLIETESKTLIAGFKNSIIPTDGSVTSIGYAAFGGCTGLTSVTIPNSVTSIGQAAFGGCTGLTSIKFNGTKAQWYAISKGTNWKYNVPSACKVICTDGTISI